jgi:tRNA(Ile)-lysidine synthetase-like protein
MGEDAGNHAKLALDANTTITCDFAAGRLMLEKGTAPASAAVEAWESRTWEPGHPTLVRLPSGAALEARPVTVSARLRSQVEAGRFDPSGRVYLAIRPDAQLSVRQWQAGDRYQPLGATGTRKLSDCFIDRKIPRRERNLRPVVCLAGDPVWVPGLLPAECCRISPETQSAVELTYRATTAS